MGNEKEKKSMLNNGLFNTKVKSANVKLKELVFGYFAGPFFGLISSGIIAGYMLKYWKDTLGLTGSFLTVMPLVAIVLIVVGNLFVGQLIDRTKSMQGRARPYVLLSAVLIALASILFFSVPTGGSDIMKFIWVAVVYVIYYAVAYPLYYTCNTSMVALSTRNGKQRGMLSSAFNLAVTGSAAGGPVVLSIVLGIAGSGAGTYLITMVIFGVLAFLFIALQYFFTRERVTEENIKLGITEQKIPFAQQLKAVAKSKFWWMIIAFYVVFQFCGAVQNSSLAFYNDYVFGSTYGDPVTYNILQLVPGIVLGAGVIFSWPLANKIGKKNAAVLGLIVSAIGCALSLFAPYISGGGGAYSATWILQLIGVIVIRLGAGPANYVMLALFAEIIDNIEAKHGFRCDGFSMSLLTIIMAVSASVAQSLINGVLDAVGYQEGVYVGETLNETIYEANKTNAGTAISWLFLGVMMIGYVVCAAALLFIKVEKTVDEDKATILERQKAAVLAEGKEWIEPDVRLQMEQDEADRIAEEARIAESKAYCEKKGISFEEREAAYQEKLRAKQAAAKAKAEAKEAKKKPKE